MSVWQVLLSVQGMPDGPALERRNEQGLVQLERRAVSPVEHDARLGFLEMSYHRVPWHHLFATQDGQPSPPHEPWSPEMAAAGELKMGATQEGRQEDPGSASSRSPVISTLCRDPGWPVSCWPLVLPTPGRTEAPPCVARLWLLSTVEGARRRRPRLGRNRRRELLGVPRFFTTRSLRWMVVCAITSFRPQECHTIRTYMQNSRISSTHVIIVNTNENTDRELEGGVSTVAVSIQPSPPQPRLEFPEEHRFLRTGCPDDKEQIKGRGRGSVQEKKRAPFLVERSHSTTPWKRGSPQAAAALQASSWALQSETDEPGAFPELTASAHWLFWMAQARCTAAALLTKVLPFTAKGRSGLPESVTCGAAMPAMAPPACALLLPWPPC
ncbi:hypothetical protein VTK73DRAFT_4416 [Phialemonium thermophilum]|uniref:Uncharacterized protein n=1 Tax=Phialemonium thermophilum TaxID=223376 RepID=A0ABR3V9K5_9PEZI